VTYPRRRAGWETRALAEAHLSIGAELFPSFPLVFSSVSSPIIQATLPFVVAQPPPASLITSRVLSPPVARHTQPNGRAILEADIIAFSNHYNSDATADQRPLDHDRCERLFTAVTPPPNVVMAEYDGLRQPIRGPSGLQHGVLPLGTDGQDWYWKYGELRVNPGDIPRWRCKECFCMRSYPILILMKCKH
jgi:hypothetical protein